MSTITRPPCTTSNRVESMELLRKLFLDRRCHLQQGVEHLLRSSRFELVCVDPGLVATNDVSAQERRNIARGGACPKIRLRRRCRQKLRAYETVRGSPSRRGSASRSMPIAVLPTRRVASACRVAILNGARRDNCREPCGIPGRFLTAPRISPEPSLAVAEPAGRRPPDHESRDLRPRPAIGSRKG